MKIDTSKVEELINEILREVESLPLRINNVIYAPKNNVFLQVHPVYSIEIKCLGRTNKCSFVPSEKSIERFKNGKILNLFSSKIWGTKKIYVKTDFAKTLLDFNKKGFYNDFLSAIEKYKLNPRDTDDFVVVENDDWM